MRRLLVFVCAVLAFVTLGLTTSADDGAVVAGQISASDHESEEGYFAVGQDVSIATRPGTELHRWLQSHVGTRIRVTLEPNVTSEAKR